MTETEVIFDQHCSTGETVKMWIALQPLFPSLHFKVSPSMFSCHSIWHQQVVIQVVMDIRHLWYRKDRYTRQKKGKWTEGGRGDPEKWTGLLWIDSSGAVANLPQQPPLSNTLSHTLYEARNTVAWKLQVREKKIEFLWSFLKPTWLSKITRESTSVNILSWTTAIWAAQVHFIDYVTLCRSPTWNVCIYSHMRYNFIHIFITREVWQENLISPQGQVSAFCTLHNTREKVLSGSRE